MKISELKDSEELLAEELRDPEFRAEWERTALARFVAHRVVTFRAEHGLSQTELARMLGVRQPAVARLEAGEHNPGLETLARLSDVLGLEFAIDITPGDEPPTFVGSSAKTKQDESFPVAGGGNIRVMSS